MEVLELVKRLGFFCIYQTLCNICQFIIITNVVSISTFHKKSNFTWIVCTCSCASIDLVFFVWVSEFKTIFAFFGFSSYLRFILCHSSLQELILILFKENQGKHQSILFFFGSKGITHPPGVVFVLSIGLIMAGVVDMD